MNLGRVNRFVAIWRTELVCLLLAAATVAVYWQVSGFEFTNYDESRMVLQNPLVFGGLTWEGISWALTTSWFEYWHPLTWLSHMLDCELFGLNPGGHHLVSLGFHVANTLLLFVVLRRTTGALWRSAMVAALFALHPQHVESVAWIAERKDVLSAFFFFLTLWAYVRYSEVQGLKSKVLSLGSKVQSPKSKVQSQEPAPRIASPASRIEHAPRSTLHAPAFYLLSLFFFACGLMSKPMLVTMPCVLLIFDYWPLRRLGLKTQDPRLKTLLLEKLPFLALSVASCAITYLGVKAADNLVSTGMVPWTLRLASVPVSYVRYLCKMIWPLELVVMYPTPSHWAWWQVSGAVLVLALITLLVFVRARKAPYLPVGWLFFLGMLFPTIGVVRVGVQSIADRYTYLPAIGCFIAIVWTVADWSRDARHDRRVARSEAASHVAGSLPCAAEGRAILPPAMATALATLALVLCGWLTWVQVRTWRNSYTLWTHCLAICPDNFVAHHNLGFLLAVSGKTNEAIAQYKAALRLKPDLQDANFNLGVTLIGCGKAQEATNYLATVLRYSPRYGRAHGVMGLALLELGDYAGAVRYCEEAIRFDANAPEPYVVLGRALSAQGKSDEALRYYAEGLRLDPALPQVHYYLGLEWMKRGWCDQAATSLSEAVRLEPSWAEARAQYQRALSAVEQRLSNTNAGK